MKPARLYCACTVHLIDLGPPEEIDLHCQPGHPPQVGDLCDTSDPDGIPTSYRVESVVRTNPTCRYAKQRGDTCWSVLATPVADLPGVLD